MLSEGRYFGGGGGRYFRRVLTFGGVSLLSEGRYTGWGGGSLLPEGRYFGGCRYIGGIVTFGGSILWGVRYFRSVVTLGGQSSIHPSGVGKMSTSIHTTLKRLPEAPIYVSGPLGVN